MQEHGKQAALADEDELESEDEAQEAYERAVAMEILELEWERDLVEF